VAQAENNTTSGRNYRSAACYIATVIDSLQLLLSRWSRRASYPLFAWICIAALPVLLNVGAGMNDDFRSSLGEYYGPISLFLMFQFSLGFTVLFLSTLLVTSVSRSQLIEHLRLSPASPQVLLLAVLKCLVNMFWPPCAAFITLMIAYLLFENQGRIDYRQLYLDRALLFVGLLALSQLGSILTICCGLGRNVFWYVLLALPVQFILTIGAVFLLISRVLPWELLLPLSLGLVMAIHWMATYNLIRLWHPRSAGRRIGS
jgi:hypothetical protein